MKLFSQLFDYVCRNLFFVLHILTRYFQSENPAVDWMFTYRHCDNLMVCRMACSVCLHGLLKILFGTPLGPLGSCDVSQVWPRKL